MAVGIGAAASQIVGGFVARVAGFPAGFFTLAALAPGALLFFAHFMPETRDDVEAPLSAEASAA